VIITLSIILFASFSIYLTWQVQAVIPAIIDASSFLYLIGYFGIVAGLCMAIAGIVLAAAGMTVHHVPESLVDAFRLQPHGPINVKRSIFITLWAMPFTGIFVTWGLQVALDGAIQARLAGLACAGFFVLIACALVILFRGLQQSKAVRIFFFLMNAGLVVLLTTLMVLVDFTGYHFVLGLSAWGVTLGAWDMWMERRVPLNRFWNEMDRFRLSHRQKRVLASYALMAAVIASPGALLLAAPKWDTQTYMFVITAKQAQATDLVMYYTSNYDPGHYYVVDLAKQFNVTLILGWGPSNINDTANGTAGRDEANFIHYANTQGVAIEVFQTFSEDHWEDYLVPPKTNDTWSLFRQWIARWHLKIDYILWDIEDGSTPSSIVNKSSLWPFDAVEGLTQRYKELPTVKAAFERLVVQTEAIGAKTRITTYGPGDVFDGDSDIYILDGIIGYLFPDMIANGSIQYVSTMAYTNHWGDISPYNMSGDEAIYDNARMLRRLNPGACAVDIGNINGAGETNIEEVVNQVYLAIAGGATSVRLFNGASWVLGWDAYGNHGPYWGYNGTLALFQSIRQGGIGAFTENTSSNYGTVDGVLLDTMLNFLKP